MGSGASVAMMAAMMVPGAIPATIRFARARGGVRAVPMFVGAYVAVWALVSAVMDAAYRPPQSAAAAIVVIAAGAYELTPLKRAFRRRCRETIRSGFEFGLCCVGSCIGLMLLLFAIDVMSVAWMGAIAAFVFMQKVLPERWTLDLPMALAIVAVGILIAVMPSAVPGVMPDM